MEDGLAQSWAGETVWCNPPYGRVMFTWGEKWRDEFLNNGTTIVALPPARTDTKLFQELVVPNATAICFIKGRLRFEDGENVGSTDKVDPAPFPSMLAIYDNDLSSRKIELLNSLGSVWILD